MVLRSTQAWQCYVRPRAHRPCLTTVRSFRHQFLEIDRPERDAARLGLQLIAPTTSPVLSPPPPGGRCAPRRPPVDVQQLRVEIPTSGCTTRPRVQVPPSQGLDPATACNGPPAPWAFRGCSPVLGGWKDPSRQGRTPIPRDGRGAKRQPLTREPRRRPGDRGKNLQHDQYANPEAEWASGEIKGSIIWPRCCRVQIRLSTPDNNPNPDNLPLDMSSKGSSTTRPIASSVYLRESACVSSVAPASHDFHHPRPCFVNQPRAPIDSPQFVDNWMQLRRTWHCLLSPTDNPAGSIPSLGRPAASVLYGQGRCWACCHHKGASAVA